MARSGPLDPERGPSGEIWGVQGAAQSAGRAAGTPREESFLSSDRRSYMPDIFMLKKAPARSDAGPGIPLATSPENIIRNLLSGRPVMVWLALSEDPDASWHSPTRQDHPRQLLRAMRLFARERVRTYVTANAPFQASD